MIYILSLISVAASFLFVYFGFAMIVSEPPAWIMMFGVVTVFYGFVSFLLLMLAWLRGSKSIQTISRVLSILFLLAFMVASLDVGIISGLEWAGILFVALMIMANWFAVQRVIMRKKSA